MVDDINNKTTPNQMRVLMKRMHDGKFTVSENINPKKDLNMHDMLKIMRSINENLESDGENKKTVYDQNDEEEKLRNFFSDMTVSIKLVDLGVYEDLVFWGGTVNGIIRFVYTVTDDENTSGVEFDYLDEFSPDNPENDEIIDRLEIYFNTFYKYWRDNIVSNNNDSGADDTKFVSDNDL